MSTSVQFSPRWAKDVRELFADLDERFADFSLLNRRIAYILRDGVLTNIEERGGGTWAPLAPATLRKRASLGYGGDQPLQRSGRLQRTIRLAWDAMWAASYSGAPDTHLHEYGSQQHYTGSGGRARRGRDYGYRRSAESRRREGITSRWHEPPRTYMYISDAMKKAILDLCTEYRDQELTR